MNNESTEPDIVINGVKLTNAQAMTIRVAVNNLVLDLRFGLAKDLGETLTDGYLQQARQVNALLLRKTG